MIDNFGGKYSFLSNFYTSIFEHGGYTYPTSEHFFHAFKTKDIDLRDWIRESLSPGEAKARGRKVALREDWKDVRYGVMELAVKLKFEQNPKLAQLLIDTGDEVLVEGNSWHDNIWGVCYCEKCLHVEGQNLLGKILMKQRDELRRSQNE